MNQSDPDRERVSSLRRSRLARQGLTLGAVAGSLGIAGALGLSAVTQGAPSSYGTSSSTSSSTTSSTPPGQTGDDQPRHYVLQGGDDGGEESDDDGGRVWVPAPPSPQFQAGGQTSSAGQTAGGGQSTGGGSAPHATSGGS
jgi:hypothetical protein